MCPLFMKSKMLRVVGHVLTMEATRRSREPRPPAADTNRKTTRSKRNFYTGTAVFRAGLKKGSFTTVAVVFKRRDSMVSSICSLVPGFE